MLLYFSLRLYFLSSLEHTYECFMILRPSFLSSTWSLLHDMIFLLLIKGNKNWKLWDCWMNGKQMQRFKVTVHWKQFLLYSIVSQTQTLVPFLPKSWISIINELEWYWNDSYSKKKLYPEKKQLKWN